MEPLAKSIAIIIAILVLASGAVLGLPNSPDDRVYAEGSVECQPGQFPHLVSISVDEKHLCGGWIYNERFVVTAAECVRNLPIASIVVTVGQLRLDTEDPYEVRYNVLKVELYTADGGYNETTGIHNIALLQTVTSIDLSNPHAGFLNYDEHTSLQLATVVGWGQLADGGEPALQCRTANVSIATIEVCRSAFGELFNPVYQLCTTLNGIANACNGDEGGPVMQILNGKPIIVGMVTKVVGGCTSFTSAGMANVAAYYRWFTQTAGNQPNAV